MNPRSGPLAVLALALVVVAAGLIVMISITSDPGAGKQPSREAVGVPGGEDPVAVKTAPWTQGVDPGYPHLLVVGVDIEPGTYTSRSNGAEGPNIRCSWTRLSGLEGRSSQVLENGSGATVTILPTDKGFVTEGCGEWVPVSTTP